MNEATVSDAVESILQEAVRGLGDFAGCAEVIRGAVGDPPQDWTVSPPQGREHPDYVFSALRVLLGDGLLDAGQRVDGVIGRFVKSDQPVDWLIERMRSLYEQVPNDRPFLAGDVAEFGITPLGREALESHNQVFSTAVDEIVRDWSRLQYALQAGNS